MHHLDSLTFPSIDVVEVRDMVLEHTVARLTIEAASVGERVLAGNHLVLAHCAQACSAGRYGVCMCCR